MKNLPKVEATGRLILDAATAAEIMMPNPISIEADALVKEAAGFLADKGFSAAPVIDEAGRPIGVLSQSDLVVHDREKLECVSTGAEFYNSSDLSFRSARACQTGFEVVDVDCTRVRDIMTPVVFSVAPETPVHRVIDEMLALKVHRLFVVDGDGDLIGVISMVDVLRRLHREQAVPKKRVTRT
jgi:CBS domain-containing protein